MSDIYYSVEHIPKGDVYGAWNQFCITRSAFKAKWLKFEARMRYGKKNVYRIREV